MSTESAVVAGLTAAVFSPRTRDTLRRGAVLGVAGALRAGDVVAGAARGAVRGVKGEETAPTPAASRSGSAASKRSTPARRRSNGTRSGSSASRGGSGSSRGGSSGARSTSSGGSASSA